MKEATAKVKITPRILEFIKKHAISSRKLPTPTESYWKPEGISLKELPPNKKTVRIRVFQEKPEDGEVEELNTIIKDDSYTHDRIKLFEGTKEQCEAYLQKEGYEKWGEAQLKSTEYKIKLPSGAVVNALEEELNDKKTLIKFEAEDEGKIKEVMQLLSLFQDDLVLKNRPQLLAEEIDLI